MKILVIGGGGREHALAWKLAQSPRIQKIYVAPGNAGTAAHPDLCNVELASHVDLIEFARREDIAFTVVGPEAPLAGGVVDAFQAGGLRIFGPTQQATQLESSKSFAKAFMLRHHIPTAEYRCFSDAVAAHSYLDSQKAPIVIKADGLAAGKGVVVAATLAEAHEAIDNLLAMGQAADSRATILIEGYLQGEEASFMAMVDGHTILPLATSQDHKRLLDNDRGPNTGGMGAHSPAPVITPGLHARIMREVMVPTLHGMAEEGLPYIGFLYAGLMIDADNNLKVLEYNCRLGDPETQPVMMRLKSDLVTLIERALDGQLNEIEAEWDRRAALTVVLAAPGYPDQPKKGDKIYNLPPNNNEHYIFHAGTKLVDGDIVVDGGRVLSVTALGDSIRQAQRSAYEIAEEIHFPGMQMRRDIGSHALKR